MNRMILILLLMSVIDGCWSNSKLEYYSNLLEASQPGPNTVQLIKSFQEENPLILIAKTNELLNKKWIYEMDIKDKIIPTERSLVNYKGDCEDFAAAMMAVCNYLNIESRFALGQERYGKKSGHVWLEINICNINEYSMELNNLIEKYFPQRMLVSEKNKFWLALISKKNYSKYLINNYLYNHERIKKHTAKN